MTCYYFHLTRPAFSLSPIYRRHNQPHSQSSPPRPCGSNHPRGGAAWSRWYSPIINPRFDSILEKHFCVQHPIIPCMRPWTTHGPNQKCCDIHSLILQDFTVWLNRHTTHVHQYTCFMFRLHIMLDFKQITEIDGLNVHILVLKYLSLSRGWWPSAITNFFPRKSDQTVGMNEWVGWSAGS